MTQTKQVMCDFDAAYKLHSRCSLELVFVGNTYEPRWMDAAGNLRYHAHVVTTWKLAKAICCLYGEMDADKLSGVEIAA